MQYDHQQNLRRKRKFLCAMTWICSQLKSEIRWLNSVRRHIWNNRGSFGASALCTVTWIHRIEFKGEQEYNIRPPLILSLPWSPIPSEHQASAVQHLRDSCPEPSPSSKPLCGSHSDFKRQSLNSRDSCRIIKTWWVTFLTWRNPRSGFQSRTSAIEHILWKRRL